ncbi:HNH endonuclease [Deinococcus apachensis]|uniref:HNH endonuclease n=1 Tax=Deinococcus apachensis TaxID=309886 RepID=UPI0012FAEBA2|nr:HNH endonuclease [Deinococcus apachensis]
MAGLSEWARRVRERRDELGYMILSHKDRTGELRPDDSILTSTEPRSTAHVRNIGKGQRFRILDRDGHRCLSYGAQPGDPHPMEPDRTVRLVVDHISPISRAEKYGIDPYLNQNLQTLCDVCKEGKWNKYPGRLGEARLGLEALMRHAPLEEQRRVYELLRRILKPGVQS